MKTDPNEPITPCIHTRIGTTETRLRKEGDSKDYQVPMNGLTKREYFASIAMQGLCSDRHCSDTQGSPEMIAGMAVACADALILELNKEAL